MLALIATALGLLAPQDVGLYGASRTLSSPTFVDLEEGRFGAEPDESGPIGGGAGYANTIADGDLTARTLDELIDALAKAERGQIVFVPGDVMIDCTARVLVDELILEIPQGVTLASDRGHGDSSGAMLFSDHLATRPLLRAAGPDVRVTGLRIRGPDPERRLDHHRRSFAEQRGRSYYYRFPVSSGIESGHDELEVDNCELAGWSHAAVWLREGDDHHVHHCFIHHNQYQGLGYGVCHDVATSLIERNLFDWNRHSIAGTGRPGSGYEARHNIERGESLSHCFDMHGGRDREDGTNIAGTWMKFTRNTFWCRRPAIVVRGEPERRAEIVGNWFVHADPDAAIRGESRTLARLNAYGRAEPTVREGR